MIVNTTGFLFLISFISFLVGASIFSTLLVYIGMIMFLIAVIVGVNAYGWKYVHIALMDCITYALVSIAIITFIAAYSQPDFKIGVFVNILGEAHFELGLIVYYIFGMSYNFASNLTLKWGDKNVKNKGKSGASS